MTSTDISLMLLKSGFCCLLLDSSSMGSNITGLALLVSALLDLIEVLADRWSRR